MAEAKKGVDAILMADDSMKHLGPKVHQEESKHKKRGRKKPPNQTILARTRKVDTTTSTN